MNDDTMKIPHRRAMVPPPPRAAKRGILATVPNVSIEPPLSNMQKANSGFQDMNFKVSPEFHTVFKTVASVKRMPMKDLLEAAFVAWIEKYSDDQIEAITKSLPR